MFERPPRGPLETTPPGAVCKRGHLVLRDHEGRWRDAATVLLEWTSRLWGIQPLLGRAADVWRYGTSYLLGAAISALSLPFIALARRQKAPADVADQPDLRAAGPSAE